MKLMKLGSTRCIVAMTLSLATATGVAAYVRDASGGEPSDRDSDGDRDHDHGRGRGPQKYTIGLFGDMPYNALGKAQYPALLADINAKHVAFSVFDGDLKAGGDGPCADALYTTAIDSFNT